MTVAVRRDNVVSISTIGIPQCINNIYVTEYVLRNTDYFLHKLLT